MSTPENETLPGTAPAPRPRDGDVVQRYIVVEGRQFEAFCRDGVVDSGTRLRVVGVDNFRLIVTKPHS